MKCVAYGLCGAVLMVILAGCDKPSPDQLRTTGISEWKVGHLKQAEDAFQRVLDKYPSDADSLYYMGRISHGRKEFGKAMYYYQCALDANPAYEPARYWLKVAEQDAPEVAKALRFIPEGPERPQK